MKKEFTTVDEFIVSFPKEIQVKLIAIRSIIIETVPEAEEGISYGMPAYKTFNKPLIYFFSISEAHRLLCNSIWTTRV